MFHFTGTDAKQRWDKAAKSMACILIPSLVYKNDRETVYFPWLAQITEGHQYLTVGKFDDQSQTGWLDIELINPELDPFPKGRLYRFFRACFPWSNR